LLRQGSISPPSSQSAGANIGPDTVASRQPAISRNDKRMASGLVRLVPAMAVLAQPSASNGQSFGMPFLNRHVCVVKRLVSRPE
jgi:hypothetical protein